MSFFYFFAYLLFQIPLLMGDYVRPSHIKEKSWNQVSPYFLPESHLIKTQLDQIFKMSRAVLNPKSLENAGFIQSAPQKVTRIFVTKHIDIPGYIFKIYLDSQRAHKNKSEDFFWIKRIEGARSISAFLDEKNWTAFFKVPKKWIYPLPSKPTPPSGYRRINYILVEEDMDLLDSKTNDAKWKSEAIEESLLTKLFTLLETLGLRDCTKTDNIPFSKDGKIAFIDTQSHHEWPVTYKKFSKCLGKKQKKKWNELIKSKTHSLN